MTYIVTNPDWVKADPIVLPVSKHVSVEVGQSLYTNDLKGKRLVRSRLTGVVLLYLKREREEKNDIAVIFFSILKIQLQSITSIR